MAHLHRDDEDPAGRESWLKWAIELGRRGLVAGEYVTVHGPHESPADCMWGEADCGSVLRPGSLVVEFRTSPCISIWGVKGLNVWDKANPEEKYAVVRSALLPSDFRKTLLMWKRERRRLHDDNTMSRKKNI